MKKIILVLSCIFLFACEKKKTDPVQNDLGNAGSDESKQGLSATWLSGVTVPDPELGKDGDFYLQSNGDVYIKKQEVWTLFTSLMGPQGIAGLVGPSGPMGPAGTPGLPGAQGIAGAPGPQGEMGEKGEKGDPGRDGTNGANGTDGVNGRDGLDGLNANMITLFAKVGQTPSLWVSPRNLRMKMPSDVDVIYGTGGNGSLYINIASRMKCVYRGQGGAINSRPGTTDYEIGKVYQFEKCVQFDISDLDIMNKSSTYSSAPSINVTSGVDLQSSEALNIKILKAGDRIPSAKVMGSLIVL